jgi:outer membrane protein assembly factor BamB
MRTCALACMILLAAEAMLSAAAPQPEQLFANGVAVDLSPLALANERSVERLVALPGGLVVGSTSGLAAHLFAYDPEADELYDLDRIPGPVSLSALTVESGVRIYHTPAEYELYAGTMRCDDFPAKAGRRFAGGHLYKYQLDRATMSVRRTDLGVPVQGQGLYALRADSKRGVIYGITHPDGELIAYELDTGKVHRCGSVASLTPITEEKRLPRDIWIGSDDRAHTSGPDGYLHYCDPETWELVKSDVRLPAVLGRHALAYLESATAGRDGTIYGGTSDGYVFSLDAKTGAVRNHGKALRQAHIAGLVAGMDGVIYGVGGEPAGYPRGFAFDPGTGSFILGSYPKMADPSSRDSISAGYSAMAVGDGGRVFVGEKGRIGRLVVFPPEGVEDTGGQEEVVAEPVAESPPSAPLGPAPRERFLDCQLVHAPDDVVDPGEGIAYTAIELGKDGCVYIGTCHYLDTAWMIRYVPERNRIEKVADAASLTHWFHRGYYAQSKLHAKVLVAADGTVYFGSNQGFMDSEHRSEWGEDEIGYPGGHLLAYHPAKDLAYDLGMLGRGASAQFFAGAIDDKRGKLYYWGGPDFIVHDIETSRTELKGQLTGQARYFAIDKAGVVWIPGASDPVPVIERYDPRKGYLETLPLDIAGDGEYRAPYAWVMGAEGTKVYGWATSHPDIMEFDIAEAGESVPMRGVAPTMGSEHAHYDVTDIHAAVLGADGRLYCPVLAESRHDGSTGVHLIRYDPATEAATDLGIIRSRNRPGYSANIDRMQGGCVAPDGTLYLMEMGPKLSLLIFPQLTSE